MPYLAGAMLAEHGLGTGFDKGLIAKFCEQNPAVKPENAEVWLRQAWHGIKGYLDCTTAKQ